METTHFSGKFGRGHSTALFTRIPHLFRYTITAEQGGLMARLMVWTPDLIRKFWLYQKSENPENFFSNQQTKRLFELFKPYFGERHLDYGAGEGSFVRYVQSKGLQSLGWEPGTPRPIGAFSSVTLFEVMEHLDDEALEQTIKNIKGYLSRGGYLIASVPNEEKLEEKFVYCPNCAMVFHPMQHVRSWNANSLLKYLHAKGFSIVKVIALTFWKKHNSSFRVRAKYRIRGFFNKERYENLLVVAKKMEL